MSTRLTRAGNSCNPERDRGPQHVEQKAAQGLVVEAPIGQDKTRTVKAKLPEPQTECLTWTVAQRRLTRHALRMSLIKVQGHRLSRKDYLPSGGQRSNGAPNRVASHGVRKHGIAYRGVGRHPHGNGATILAKRPGQCPGQPTSSKVGRECVKPTGQPEGNRLCAGEGWRDGGAYPRMAAFLGNQGKEC